MTELSPKLAREVAAWREEGKVIVFTNGVFDLLHPGHIALLRQAKSFGDVLIVGLNSDFSIRSLDKGLPRGAGGRNLLRPILDESARRGLLLAIRYVDAVELFDEPTPLELVEQVLPDVLVKGADYAEAVVVGREEVEAAGGRVELVPLVPEYSTTGIIQKIRG
ncbi:adenylyltransferase/cytidyltransferase family protein [bacterium]|nr:adenylyltransferase/cytidyltransferase family protein [bacterium]